MGTLLEEKVRGKGREGVTGREQRKWGSGMKTKRQSGIKGVFVYIHEYKHMYIDNIKKERERESERERRYSENNRLSYTI
jgi:hypothetical protein